MKQLLDKCPICTKGNISLKTIDEFIKVGNNTAIIKVKVESCSRCGENFYDPETIREIEFIRKELKNRKSKILIPIGQTYALSKS
jgi:YgiT-type zinc finger domain-containing protein